MSYKITDAEKEIVKMNSPFVLPDSPTAGGMKASDIKKYHYQAYLELIKIINVHLDDVSKDIESKDKKINEKSTIHYIGDMSSLVYWFTYLKENLKKEDIILFGDMLNQDLSIAMIWSTEGGGGLSLGRTLSTNSIVNYDNWETGKIYEHHESKVAFLYLGNINVSIKVDELNASLEELEARQSETQNGLDDHKVSSSAHSDIRELVNSAQSSADAAQSRADNAYNLARGKARVHPVADISEMYSVLQNTINEVNEGDVFIIAEPLIPEFIVYSKDVDMDEGDINISVDSLPSFEAGESYYIADLRVRLLALESGIDTSAFATKVALEALMEDTRLDDDFSLESEKGLKNKVIAEVIKGACLEELANKFSYADSPWINNPSNMALTINGGAYDIVAIDAVQQVEGEWQPRDIPRRDMHGCIWVPIEPSCENAATSKAHVDALNAEVKELANSAYNLAKKKVYVQRNIGSMYNLLEKYYTKAGLLKDEARLYTGDHIIVVENGFQIFEIYAVSPDATVLNDSSAFEACEWQNNTIYYIEPLGVYLLAKGSKIDTSKLASKTELDELRTEIEAGLDIIIAKQEELIGGDSV